jgi:hypothetical protein
MKKIIFIVSFISLSGFSRAQWQQTSLDSVLISCMASCGANIYAGTFNYGLLYSVDSGLNWTAINTGLPDSSIRALAINDTNIFVVTENHGVFLSTNNGANWTPVNNGLPAYFIYSLAINDNKIFTGTSDGVYISSNNGADWSVTGLTSCNVFPIAISGANIFAGTGGGILNYIYLSTDTGVNWSVVYNASEYDAINAFAFNASDIFGGTNYGVQWSDNNGTSWTEENSGLGYNHCILSLAADSNYIFAGTPDDFYYSDVNNISWTSIKNNLPNDNFLSILINGPNVFVGTSANGVWKRPLSDFVGIKEATENNLFKLYPNPAANNLTIESMQKSILEITNVHGQVIQTLTSANLKTEIDISKIAKGIYFVKVETEKGIAVKKFIKE